MKIVLGLGNPGERYRWTRHNLGHKVVDLLAERWGDGEERRAAIGRAAWALPVQIAGQAAILSKSRTFMNRSGRAAVALREHYGIEARDLLVVYDDADLELGRVRIRPQGGAGGHNGMRSVIAALATESFARIRLGVSGRHREASELADYVLTGFSADEQPVARALVALGADAVEAVLGEGIPEAMNRYNGQTARPER